MAELLEFRGKSTNRLWRYTTGRSQKTFAEIFGLAHYTFDVDGTDALPTPINLVSAGTPSIVAAKWSNGTRLDKAAGDAWEKFVTNGIIGEIDRWSIGGWIKLDTPTTGLPLVIYSESDSNTIDETYKYIGIIDDAPGGAPKVAWVVKETGSAAGVFAANKRSTTTIPAVGALTHICLTHDRGDVKLYIDGVLDTADFSYVYQRTAGIDWIAFGALKNSSGLGGFWDGDLDDWQLYSTILTPAEVLLIADPSTQQSVIGAPFAPSSIQRKKRNIGFRDGDLKLTVPHDLAPFSEFNKLSTMEQIHCRIYSTAGAFKSRFRLRDVKFRQSGSNSDALLAVVGGDLIGDATTKDYSAPCPFALYDSDCTLSAANNSDTVAVSAIVDEDTNPFGNGAFQMIHATFALRANDFFTNGFAIIGDEKIHVTAHTGSTVVLSVPFRLITGTPNVVVSAGCDQTHTACRTKFDVDNFANFGGSPSLPDQNPTTDIMAEKVIA